jgi:hypothetical protein
MRKGQSFDNLGRIVLWILLLAVAVFGIYSLLKKLGIF